MSLGAEERVISVRQLFWRNNMTRIMTQKGYFLEGLQSNIHKNKD
ncbi:MAG: hypothetical protein ACLPI9_02445 [Halobacteriota archaeon]|jgi:hypothetical protein